MADELSEYVEESATEFGIPGVAVGVWLRVGRWASVVA